MQGSEPAFPIPSNTTVPYPTHPGMSTRLYVASHIAGHIEAEWQRGFGSGDYGEELPTAHEVAIRSVEVADALIAACKESPND